MAAVDSRLRDSRKGVRVGFPGGRQYRKKEDPSPESVRQSRRCCARLTLDSSKSLEPAGWTYRVEIQLLIPELLDEFEGLRAEEPGTAHPDYPFILAAGERRGTTANTIFRDPAWRKKDGEGALRMSPEDAEALGIASGDPVRVPTKRASLDAVVEITDSLRSGHVTLPNGLGVAYPDEKGERVVHGVPPNELTASEDRDWFAGTPWHKHVRARIEVLETASPRRA